MNYYDIISKGYNELYQEEQSNKIRIIRNNIKINNKTKILDVGCGTGISSDFGCFIVGIDLSIGLLKQNKNERKLQSISEALPFKNEIFDYVVSVTSIHNFDNIEKSINEMKRVGKENFVFSVLKRSRKINPIKNLLQKNFKITKVIEEGKDAIFFCQKSLIFDHDRKSLCNLSTCKNHNIYI